MKATRHQAGILLSLLIQAQACFGAGYMGGAIGLSEINEAGELDSLSLDNRSLSGGLFGGYQFNRYVALEGSARWLGIFSSDITDERYAALTASALGILPFADTGFDGYLQLGIGAMLTSDSQDISPTAEAIADNAGVRTTLQAGIGLRYRPPTSPRMTVRLGFESYSFKMRYTLQTPGAESEPTTRETEEFRQTIINLFLSLQLNF